MAQPTKEEEQSLALETAVATARNVERVVSIGVKSPMNFCLGLARGFRNIPRLYNDDTVRPVGKVTDLASGIRTAGKELGYGFYDGISGLVTQPIRGAEKEGAAGLVKGIGKGVAGLIAKPGAGIWGLPAYMMQGVHAEVNKLFSRSVENYIITSRVQQGQIELQHASAQEQIDVTRRWETVKWELHRFYQFKRASKGKAKDGEVQDDTESPDRSPTPSEIGFSKPKRSWLQQRLGPKDKEYTRARRAWKDGYVEANVPGSDTGESPLESAELEQAIQASVRETSRGNAEEDARVEAAMRQSIHAMEDRGAPVPGMMPAGIPGQSATIFEDDEYKITDEEYQRLIEEAIQQSVMGGSHASSGYLPDIKRPPGPIQRSDTDDLYTSMDAGPALPPRDADLERAIEASKADMEKAKTQQSEEDIVLEYIKKQSLAEEEFRKQKAVQGPSSHDDDAELNRALEESLKLSGQDPAAGPSEGR